MRVSAETADVLGWLMAGMFVAVGLILTAGALWVTVDNLKISRQHERVEGEVVELRWPPGRKPGDRIGKAETFSVVVRIPWRGKTRQAEFESRHGSWERGEAVALYVNPERPWKVSSASFFERWFLALVLASPRRCSCSMACARRWNCAGLAVRRQPVADRKSRSAAATGSGVSMCRWWWPGSTRSRASRSRARRLSRTSGWK